MSVTAIAPLRRTKSGVLIDAEGWPLLYEDDEEGDMGEVNQNTDADEILHLCLEHYFAKRSEVRVFRNMNLYYHPDKFAPYVSPDGMIVRPSHDLGERVTSYRIGKHGPAPILVWESLSERTAQQRDLDEKMRVYAKLRIPEYILIDPARMFLDRPILMKRLRGTVGKYQDENDKDGGVTSRLGFRIIMDGDNRLRVFDAAQKREILRPDEAITASAGYRKQMKEYEDFIRRQGEEIERLRAAIGKQGKNGKNGAGKP